MTNEKKYKVDVDAVTPKRLINAINQAIKYAHVSDLKIKEWLESENQHAVIDEICALVEKSIDENTWKKIKI